MTHIRRGPDGYDMLGQEDPAPAGGDGQDGAGGPIRHSHTNRSEPYTGSQAHFNAFQRHVAHDQAQRRFMQASLAAARASDNQRLAQSAAIEGRSIFGEQPAR